MQGEGWGEEERGLMADKMNFLNNKKERRGSLGKVKIRYQNKNWCESRRKIHTKKGGGDVLEKFEGIIKDDIK